MLDLALFAVEASGEAEILPTARCARFGGLTRYRSAISATGAPGTRFQHGPVPLLGHAQLPQYERECRTTSEAAVSSIKRDSTCEPMMGCDNFLYGFKGAPPARRA